MIASGFIFNIICMTELPNKPKVACTQLQRLYFVVFPLDLYLIDFGNIFRSLRDVNFTITQATEPLGRFYGHLSRLYKQKSSIFHYQHCANPFALTRQRKHVDLPEKSFSCTSKQLFAIPHLQWCLPPDDPRVLCANTGIQYCCHTGNSFIELHEVLNSWSGLLRQTQTFFGFVDSLITRCQKYLFLVDTLSHACNKHRTKKCTVTEPLTGADVLGWRNVFQSVNDVSIIDQQ